MKIKYKPTGEKIIAWKDGGRESEFVVPEKGRHVVFKDKEGREVREYDSVVDEKGVECVAYRECVVSLDEKHVYADYEWTEHEFSLKEGAA